MFMNYLFCVLASHDILFVYAHVTIYWVSSTILINILNTIILNVNSGLKEWLNNATDPLQKLHFFKNSKTEKKLKRFDHRFLYRLFKSSFIIFYHLFSFYYSTGCSFFKESGWKLNFFFKKALLFNVYFETK